MLGLNRRTSVESLHYSIAVLTLPPILPVNFLPHGKIYRWVNRFNANRVARSIQKAMKQFRFSKPIVINAFAPGLGVALVGKLNETKTIYYCYDEITQANWSKRHGGAMEKIFSASADAIVVSSEALCEEKRQLNKNCFVVKNGVDAEVFKNGAIIKNEMPVVGFIGSLDSRVDFRLLDEIIMQSPEITFRFIGQIVDERFHLLKTWKNVEWIPPVSYEKLPKHVAQFDVGIIPFIKSEFTKKIYPLKINEYLAMGKPVVMTSFASLPEFENIVERADDAHYFKQAITKVLLSDNDELRKSRRRFSENNSWAARASEFDKIIKSLL